LAVAIVIQVVAAFLPRWRQFRITAETRTIGRTHQCAFAYAFAQTHPTDDPQIRELFIDALITVVVHPVTALFDGAFGLDGAFGAGAVGRTHAHRFHHASTNADRTRAAQILVCLVF